MRNCAYLADFDKPKIVWGEISDKPKFAFDNGYFYEEATNFIMTGDNLKFLLTILNSKLSQWYFEQISTTTGMGTNRWKKFKLELLPIAMAQNENDFIELADKILELKKEIAASAPPPRNDHAAVTTSELETKIDDMVYELYGLNEDEIKIIG